MMKKRIIQWFISTVIGMAIVIAFNVASSAEVADYVREDVRTNTTKVLYLDRECLIYGAGQTIPDSGDFTILAERIPDIADWESAQTLAAVNCSIILQRLILDELREQNK